MCEPAIHVLKSCLRGSFDKMRLPVLPHWGLLLVAVFFFCVSTIVCLIPQHKIEKGPALFFFFYHEMLKKVYAKSRELSLKSAKSFQLLWGHVPPQTPPVCT